MKCEICHDAEAACVLKVKREDGAETELFVCRACAARRDKSAPAEGGDAKDGPEFHFPSEDGEPPPFVKDLVEATIGFMHGVVNEQAKKSRKCPQCGTTWEKAKKENRLGCPACWKTFAKTVREEYLGHEYGPCHVGEAPASLGVERTRERLARELKRAVAREDFKRAAELRRQLDALERGEGAAR